MSFFNNLLRIISRKPKALENNIELNEIETLFVKGDVNSAISKISQYRDNIPSYLDYGSGSFFTKYLNLLEARAMVTQNKFEEGLKLITTEIDGDNPNPVIVTLAKIEKANSTYLSGNLNDAMNQLISSNDDVEALKLFYPNNYLKNSARLNSLRGKISFRKSEFDQAVEFLENSIQKYEKIGDKYIIADPIRDLGNITVRRGKIDEALDYYNRSLTIYEELNNQSEILKIYNNIGLGRWNSGQLEEALEDLSKALKISQDLDITSSSASILSNMGLIYIDQGKVSDGINVLSQALTIFEELENKQLISFVQLNLGYAYQYLGELDKSLEYHNKAREIYEEFDAKAELVTSYSSIAYIHGEKSDYKQALELCNKSIEIGEEIGLLKELLDPISNSIEYLINLDQMDQAQLYLDKLDKIQKQVDTKLSEHLFKLSKAKILNVSDRVVQRAEAQKLFQEVADDEIVSQVYTTEAMLKLGELLLTELRLSASEEALNEFKGLIDRLDKVTRTQIEGSSAATNKITMVQVLILQSKLAIIDLNMEGAQKLLDEAYNLANENGFNSIANNIDKEREDHKNNLLKYKKMVETNASLYERLQQSQIENYLKRAESILKR